MAYRALKMSLRLNTMAEVEALKQRMKTRSRGALEDVAALCTPGRSKYNAEICAADNIKFRSKKERKRYLELKALQHAGDVLYFHRQIAFDLPGNTRYWADFLVFWKDGRAVYEDVKGKKLAAYIRNKKQVEALYPVRIIEP